MIEEKKIPHSIQYSLSESFKDACTQRKNSLPLARLGGLFLYRNFPMQITRLSSRSRSSFEALLDRLVFPLPESCVSVCSSPRFNGALLSAPRNWEGERWKVHAWQNDGEQREREFCKIEKISDVQRCSCE